jgi:hypothetical protein
MRKINPLKPYHVTLHTETAVLLQHLSKQSGHLEAEIVHQALRVYASLRRPRDLDSTHINPIKTVQRITQHARNRRAREGTKP